nr:hypothetical protein [Tanacetum cinerariifolium]
DDEDKEEHLAPADSSDVPIVDLVLPVGDTEALEADEPTHAPGSPIIISLSQTRLRKARKTVRPEPPMSASMEACIARHAAFLHHQYLTDILEADIPPQKRDCLTTPAFGFEIGESSIAGAARQPGPTKSDLRRCRGVNERVIELDTIVRQRTDEFEIRFEEAQDNRALLPPISAIAAHARTLETQVAALISQTSSLQTQLTTALVRIEILEARDPEP